MEKETSQALSVSEEKEPEPQFKQRKHFKNKMHLWEFILELLHDNVPRSVITWTNKEKREFKIVDTEEVARLWGQEHGRRGMTFDKLSRALRQYYCEGIIRKVKGQRTTFKFGNLPYEYHPGITRRRKTAPRETRVFPYPQHGMKHGNYIDDPKWRATMLWSNGRGNNALDLSKLAVCSSFYPDSQREKSFRNVTHGYIRNGDHVIVQPPCSFRSNSPQTTTRIWFPKEPTAKCSADKRRNANNRQTFRDPKMSDSSSPLQALRQEVSCNVMPFNATYARLFPTPEPSPSCSPMRTREQNMSRSETPSPMSRSATPSPANYDGRIFTFVTPQSCNSNCPLHVAEPQVSRNVTPSDVTHGSVRVSNGVVCPTPVYPWANTVPYLPFAYVVPVQTERYLLITSVTGNYHGHPEKRKDE